MARRGTWRRRILDRDNWRCHFCARQIHARDPRSPEYGTIDHLTPLSRGGMSIDANVVAACRSCNRRKGNLTEEEFLQAGMCPREAAQ